jgi:hypothetical protein
VFRARRRQKRFDPTPDAFTSAPVRTTVTGSSDPGERGSAPVVADVQPTVDPTTAADLRRLRDLSHLLDDSIPIPGTGFRIGVEPLIGLLPVVGDGVGLVVSAYVLAVAARSGVPRATLARVAVVLWLDAVVGAVPVVGDLFDAYWKATLRTTALLEARVAEPASAAADRRYLRRLAVVVLALALAGGVVLVALAWRLVDLLGVTG